MDSIIFDDSLFRTEEKRLCLDFANNVDWLARAALQQAIELREAIYQYDTSRNHSRRWCDMQGCGNRAKARLHSLKKKAREIGE